MIEFLMFLFYATLVWGIYFGWIRNSAVLRTRLWFIDNDFKRHGKLPSYGTMLWSPMYQLLWTPEHWTAWLNRKEERP